MIIGIVGGGQLARMMMLAGYPLGFRFVALDPAKDACAGQVGELIHAGFEDEEGLRELATRADVITFEFENIPDQSIRYLTEHRPVYPCPDALAVSQDRLREKTLFTELGIPTPKYHAVDSLDELKAAIQDIGLPIILKTRRLGYDGKGQARIRSHDDLDQAWETLGGVPLIAEEWVSFDREISIIAARSRLQPTQYYPVPENTHREGILFRSVCRPGDRQQAAAEELIDRLLTHFDYTGILTLELFEVGGKLLANEIAPRVHNSGHWTIEGAEISQFENHLRAISGLPLGSTAAKGSSAMINLIGSLPDRKTLLAHDDAHFHAYGKAPREARKVGHVTINTSDPAGLEVKMGSLEKYGYLAMETKEPKMPPRVSPNTAGRTTEV